MKGNVIWLHLIKSQPKKFPYILTEPPLAALVDRAHCSSSLFVGANRHLGLLSALYNVSRVSPLYKNLRSQSTKKKENGLQEWISEHDLSLKWLLCTKVKLREGPFFNTCKGSSVLKGSVLFVGVQKNAYLSCSFFSRHPMSCCNLTL